MSKPDDGDEAIASGIRRRINKLEAPEPSTPAVARVGQHKDRATMSGRPRWSASLGLGFVAIVVVVGALAFRTISTAKPSSESVGGPSAASATTGTAAAAATQPTSQTSIQTVTPPSAAVAAAALPGPVFDLAFDQTRNSLWYAYLADQPTLYEYDIATGKTSTFPLPAGDDAGMNNKIRLSPDGSIWLFAGYRVMHVDPASRSVATHLFTVADPDANSAATDPNASSPGSWISAATITDKGVALVARHNVRSLTRMDASLNVVDRVPLPGSLVGPADLAYSNGLIYAAPDHPGRGIVFTEQGALAGSMSQSISRVGASGTSVAALGPQGVSGIASNGTAKSWLPLNQAGPATDRLVVTQGGAVVYLTSPGLIEWVRSDGQVDGTFQLPSKTVMVGNHLGTTVPAYQQDQVGGLASDKTDSVWFVDVSTNQLVHLQF